MSKRETKRFIRRLEVEFEGGGLRGRGLTSDISRKGLFIRTQKALAPGTPITVRVHLSNGRISTIKGLVRRAIKFPIYTSEIKNGMGIEIIEMDPPFDELIGELESEGASRQAPEEQQKEDFIILVCPSCGVKNRVPSGKVSLSPRCGKCRAPLIVH